MAPPPPPPAPGVVVVQVLAPPSLQSLPQKPARRAHVAIYTGMSAVELARVLQNVLALPTSVECTGFLVVDAHSVSHHHHHAKTKKKKAQNGTRTASSSTYQRIVPLSLACIAPDLLTTPSGFVTALVATHSVDAAAAPASASPQPAPINVSSALQAPSPPPPTADTTTRVARFVTAVVADNKLSAFEAAVLFELCDQQPAVVLEAMRSRDTTVAAKQQFLLDFVRQATGATTVHAATPPPIVTSSTAPLSTTLLSPTTAATAQVALVTTKLHAIAHSCFAPQIQNQIRNAAASYQTAQPFKPLLSDAAHNDLMELLSVVERLVHKHALKEEHVAYVVRLVLTNDRMLRSAVQLYRTDANAHEFERAVVQIAALQSVPTGLNAGKQAKTATPTQRNRSASPTTQKSQLTAPPRAILDALYAKSMVTRHEIELLRALVEQSDAQVLQVIDTFNETHDALALQQALVGIVADILQAVSDDDSDDSDDSSGDMSSNRINPNSSTAPTAAAAVAASLWPMHLVRFIDHWGSTGALALEAVDVLERLVEARHLLLQSAFEAFASDKDERELLDTLQRIAALQLEADDGAALQQFSGIVQSQCDSLQPAEKALVTQLFVRRDALVRAAWDVYQVEQNVQELGDTLLRIARFTRRSDATRRLVDVVGEMLRRQLIRSHEADGLLQLFAEKNAALLAANEAFEADGDVQELIETLLLVVKHASFGAPPVYSPRHTAARPPAFSMDYYVGDSVALNDDTDTVAGARLVQALGDANRIADWQRELLLVLLSQQDDRVLAALDVCSSDSDVDELVDTLERLCGLLVWQEHGSRVLREWIVPLEANRRVPLGVLQSLVERRDDRVLAALVVFLGDNDADDFVDSLERIAWLTAAAAANSSRKVEDEEEEGDRAAVLVALEQDALLSTDDTAALALLLEAGDAQALAAFDVFDATNDRNDLVDTLQRIVALRRQKAAKNGSTKQLVVQMEKQLLHFASELKLPAAEFAALKRSIAQQDEILTAAVQVFALEQDEDDLKDTLKRVAHHIVSSTAEP